MSAKPTGLAAFSQKAAPAITSQGSFAKGTKLKAQGDTVALTLRVSKSDWMRLRQLAASEGLSLTALAKSGLSKELAERGLPGLTD